VMQQLFAQALGVNGQNTVSFVQDAGVNGFLWGRESDSPSWSTGSPTHSYAK
jgi:hypothetical protein